MAMFAPTPPKTSGASFARGQSKQDYATPQDFRYAVIKRFGGPYYDLACDEKNQFGLHGITKEEDSFKVEWHKIGNGLLWLNPEFDDIAPWAKKCREEAALGARILLLTPASVGSVWYRDHVFKYSRTIFLNGRLCFDGKAPYPKDCMASAFNIEWPGHFSIWDWKKDKLYA